MLPCPVSILARLVVSILSAIGITVKIVAHAMPVKVIVTLTVNVKMDSPAYGFPAWMYAVSTQ